MKKQIIVVAIIAILAVLIAIIFATINGGTIKDENIINDIKEAAYLDIIVNLGDYTSSNYDEPMLLDVAMQIATEKGLKNEFSDADTGTYVEYVTKNDLHQIISELTGITIEAPIEITDFYYLYDSENEYYYCRPSTPSYYKIDDIESVKSSNSTYTIRCTLSKETDFELTTASNVEISITYMPDNQLVKYKVNRVSF